MSTNARIFTGQVMHGRLSPVKHTFQYPIYWYSFDLDALETLQKEIRLFSYNRFNVISLHDSDYLTTELGSIKEKLLKYLASAGCGDGIRRVELVTSARYFGYVFNPVSFYYCYRADGSLRCAVAEVNNTFYERHLYILDCAKENSKSSFTRYTVEKHFHVSPFNDVRGEYDFFFSTLGETLDIRINLIKEGKEVFVSRMWGTSRPLSSLSLLTTIAKFPITALLTIPRIYWQAFRLHFQRRLPVITKPNPSSIHTIKVAGPTFREKLGMRVCRRMLSQIEHGALIVQYPEGHTERFGSAQVKNPVTFVLKNYYPFWKVIKHGGIGFGESYVDGDWECSDLTGVLKLILNNPHTLDERAFNKVWLVRMWNRFQHWLQRNNLTGSKDNIEAHYNLSNDLFKLFLDPTMMYSCGIYSKPEMSLADAQKEKVSRIIEKSRLSAEDHLLEIGSGWGNFAIAAAKSSGCEVTSISLSQEQIDLAEQRVKDAGLNNQIRFKLIDYRKIQGKFDRIVSIEMLEAVGKEYLGAFFAACERVLKPNGVVVLQVITSPDSWYDSYCRRQDWIQKRIFPGSHLPCLAALMEAMKKNSSLVVENIENIGPHYARTLKEWRENFDAKGDAVTKLGFDEHFKRSWRFYLSSCEAEFETRWLNVYQIVLTRPNNSALIAEDYSSQMPSCQMLRAG